MENWEVVTAPSNPYQAPELWKARLRGDVIDHPRLGTQKGVVTSSIQKSEGRWVKTRNTTYELVGEPAAPYKEWCDENGIVIDNDWPVKFRESDNE